MHVSVTQYTESESVYYRIALDGAEPGEEYRARLFLYYGGVLSYSGDAGRGLTTNVFGTSYDDWSCEFRPPRIDAHKFNTEISVPLASGTNVAGFSGGFAEDSESYVSDADDPVNILVERKLGELTLRRITASRGKVELEIDEDIPDGTAVTIGNVSLAERHLLGTDGLRVCGTYRIYRVSGNVYRYATAHYADVFSAVDVPVSGYTATVWEAVDYQCGEITLEKIDAEHAGFIYGDDPGFVSAGDRVLLDSYLCRVSGVSGGMTVVDAAMEDRESAVYLNYCPRVPSAAVPVNWPTLVFARTRSENDEVVNSNSPDYDHTENTETVTPSEITYFVDGDGLSHSNEGSVVASCGSVKSVACMKFAANQIRSAVPDAVLRMYVDRMDVSEATVVLYQMSSDSWDSMMTYGEISGYVTSIPVGTASLTNPALLHVNTYYGSSSADDPGSYGQWVDIHVDSDVVEQWLDGNVSFAPSFAVRVIGDGDQSVTFSADSELKPRIVLTGGEGSAYPEPFAVVLSSDSAEHGQILRISPEEPGLHDFGSSIYNLAVEIGGAAAPVVSGDSTYLDVVVPDTVTGPNTVTVYRTVSPSTGERVQVTDGGTSVYVSTELSSRSVKLAEKLRPGVVDIDRVGHYAIYNRDFGFSGMKEVTDENSMIQNVYSILLTNPGERLFNSKFGTGIEQRLFKLGSQEGGLELLKECIQQVNRYEPRVYVDGDQSSCEFDESENHYTLILAVVLPSGNVETVQLPFRNRGRIVR